MLDVIFRMKKFIFIVAAVILLGLGGVFWSNPSPPFPPVVTLNSGPFHRVLFVPDDTTEDVFAYLVFPYGEAQNPYAQGLPHYVEHLAYQNMVLGDDNRPVHSNAWTNLHTTGYWENAPAQSWDASLRRLILVADPLQVAQDFAASELDILMREYDFRVAEQALFPVQRDMDRLLHNDGPLARSVIGGRDEIQSYTLQMAVELHEKTHRLSDATLLIYGNVSQSDVQAVIDDLGAASADAGPASVIRYGPIEPLLDRQVVQVEQALPPTYLFQSLVPVAPCAVLVDCDVALRVAADGLDSGLPGGLAGPLRFDQFIASRFSFWMGLAAPDRVFVDFWANPDNGVLVDELDDAFVAIWTDRVAHGLPPETIEQKRQQIMTSLDAILPKDRAGAQFEHILDSVAENRPLYDLNDWYRSVANITPEQINTFLTSLNTPHRTVVRHVFYKE